MCHVSVQGIDECIINTHYYYYYDCFCSKVGSNVNSVCFFGGALHILFFVCNFNQIIWVWLQQLQVHHDPLLPCGQHKTMVWLPELGVFCVCTDADAYDRAQELYEHSSRICTES